MLYIPWNITHVIYIICIYIICIYIYIIYIYPTIDTKLYIPWKLCSTQYWSGFCQALKNTIVKHHMNQWVKPHKIVFFGHGPFWKTYDIQQSYVRHCWSSLHLDVLFLFNNRAQRGPMAPSWCQWFSYSSSAHFSGGESRGKITTIPLNPGWFSSGFPGNLDLVGGWATPLKNMKVN